MSRHFIARQLQSQMRYIFSPSVIDQSHEGRNKKKRIRKLFDAKKILHALFFLNIFRCLIDTEDISAFKTLPTSRSLLQLFRIFSGKLHMIVNSIYGRSITVRILTCIEILCANDIELISRKLDGFNSQISKAVVLWIVSLVPYFIVSIKVLTNLSACDIQWMQEIAW